MQLGEEGERHPSTGRVLRHNKRRHAVLLLVMYQDLIRCGGEVAVSKDEVDGARKTNRRR